MANSLSGLGEPGQRETTRAGLETGYSLVIHQVWAAIRLGWLVIFLVLMCVFAFWVKYRPSSAYRWVGDNWPYLFVPFVVWAFVPSGFGIWRFIAEIVDPTYPTPRVPAPEVQRDGPRWPWLGEPRYADDEPASPQRIVHVELDSNGGRTRQYADLPDVPGLPGFARATAHGRAFTVRTAQAFNISRGDFETVRDAFLDRGWARWKGGDKRQGIEVLVAGRSVLRNLAVPSPTLPEGV